MASSVDLLMLYLAVEVVSAAELRPGRLQARRPSRRRGVAQVRYLRRRRLGHHVFGLSYIYGLTGSTNLMALGVRLESLAAPASAGGQAGLRVALMVAVIFVLCGIGTRSRRCRGTCGADVYEGAPTPFTAFCRSGQGGRLRARGAGVLQRAGQRGGSEGFAADGSTSPGRPSWACCPRSP